MPRNATGKLLLLFGPLLLLSVVACGGGANPPPLVASATPTAQGTLDMKAVVREFLAGLPPDWHQVASQEVAKAKPFIVDVRQPEEYGQGFIDGAVNIPLRELAQNLQALPGMDKDIVVVCDNGHRSAIGMAILQMLGYTKAKSLADGMNAWQAAKLPVVNAPVSRRAAGPAPKVNAQRQAMLDYYLVHTLPFDWGIIDPAALTEDQKLKSSSEMDVQPETFDQGPSLLVDVDEPEEFAKAGLNPTKSINAPLRSLPDQLENMPLQDTINWA